MVENERKYDLQWPKHGFDIAHQFIELLGRQALVDVKLICDNRELGVHRLVLASCSPYFEEILTRDLGPEPIIILRDLPIAILQPMIEFMYSGETTVSDWHLPPLLNAAREFKIRKLESAIEKMIGSNCNEDYAKNNYELKIEEYKLSSSNDQCSKSDDSDIESDTEYVLQCESNEDELNTSTFDCDKINSEMSCEERVNECKSQASPCGSVDSADNLQVGQCLQVYSHKKRVIKDESKELINFDHWPAANGIDLMDESSNDDTPVTLQASLDMSSWDYISSFSSENIQSIIGCSLTNNLVKDKETEQPPVLRRSVRLNQLNNEGLSPSRESPIEDKLKRDLPRKRKHNPDVNRKKGRSGSREATKSKGTKKLKYAKLRKVETIESPCESVVRPNTTPSVNRALWGDMSDLTDDRVIDAEFLEYSTSTEIPFAVGLLPLRAALERMQATLDHQPRKTRSSVASKQENATKKRVTSDTPVSTNTIGDCVPKENGSSAVCHIEIRTAPQCQRTRKRSISDSESRQEETVDRHQ